MYTGLTDNEVLENRIDKPSKEEIKLARKIAGFRLQKHWPKGVKDNKNFLSSFFLVIHKPTSDKEYHSLILKRMLDLPQKPSKYVSVKKKRFA